MGERTRAIGAPADPSVPSRRHGVRAPRNRSIRLIIALALIATMLGLPATQQAYAGSTTSSDGVVTLTKTASSKLVANGTQVTYTYTATNNDGAYRLYWKWGGSVIGSLTDDLCPAVNATTPAGLKFNGDSSYSYIDVKSSVTWTCTQTINATTSNTVTNTATLSGLRKSLLGGVYYSVPIVSATETVTVTSDLSVAMSVAPSTLAPGGTLTYTVTVSNSGTGISSGYTLSDSLPAGVSSVAFSGTPPAGCTIATNTVSCTNQPALGAGKSATYTFTAVAGTTTGNVTNTATVSGMTGDTNATNNSATANATINGYDYTLTKQASATTVSSGGPITFTVTVKNTGNIAGSTYTLTDPVPAAFSNVASSSPGASVTGNTVTWANQPGLAAGQSQTFTITATASKAGNTTNTASLSNTTGEISTTNNSASVVVGIGTNPAATSGGSWGPVTASDNSYTLTKTASTYSLPTGGGSVTYTYSIANKLTDSAVNRLYWTWTSGVVNTYGKLQDDRCNTVSAPSATTGWARDSFGDWYIDKGATATLTCTTTLVTTTTNTATVSGLQISDGITHASSVTASAKATVLVAASVPMKDPKDLELSAFTCTTPTVFNAHGAPTTLSAQPQGATTFTDIGSAWKSTYNSIAYNSANNLIYAVSQRTSSANSYDENRLLVIDSTGAVTDLGALQLAPAFTNTNISYGTVGGISGGRPGVTSVSTYGQAWNNDIYGGINFGFFDNTGTYWVGNAAASGSGVMYRVDLVTGYVYPLTAQSSAIRANDLSFAFGYAWGIKTGTHDFQRVDLSSGAVTLFTSNLTLTQMPTGTYGAAWTYGNGNLGFDNNASGGAYQIEVINPASSTPTFRLVAASAAPASSNNDGTMCTARPVDLSIAKTGPARVSTGANVSWSLAVTNQGPSVSSGFTVTDLIPSTFTYVGVSWAGGKCTYDSTGRTLTCVSSGTLAVGATSTITINATAGSSNACYTNSAFVLGNEQDPTHTNDHSSTQTCVGTGAPATCDKVMYGSFGANGWGSVGTLVNSTGVLATPASVMPLGASYDTYNETSGIAVDTLDPNFVYWSGRSGSTFSDSLYRLDLRTGTSTVVGVRSPAWQTNRLAVSPDGTVWSFPNNGHLYSWNPATGAIPPMDYGPLQPPSGETWDFATWSSGDIAFDGIGNMWILATSGTTVNPDGTTTSGETYLLMVSGSGLMDSNPQAITVGKMTAATVGYYNGLAFGPDGTLYATSTSTQNDATGGNYLYAVSPSTGSATQLKTYPTANFDGNYDYFGDLGSCALPKPNLNATKTVSPAGPVKPGDTLTYTITLSNTGNLLASGVAVDDTLPTGLSYVAGSTMLNGLSVTDDDGFPYGDWHEAHGATTIFPGVLPAGDTATITFQAMVRTNFAGTQICNQGNVQYTDGSRGTIDTDDPTTTTIGDSTCLAVAKPTKPVSIAKQGLNCDVGQPTCPLTGAAFALYSTDPSSFGATPIAGGVTVNPTDGSKFTTVGLTDGATYWLVETKAPAKFNLMAQPVKFSFSIQNGVTLLAPTSTAITVSQTDPFTIVVSDTTAAPLPKAGGSGPLPFLFIGLLLLAGAGLYHKKISGHAIAPRRAAAS